MKQSTYERFLLHIGDKIIKDAFTKNLKNFQEIDSNHYSKKINVRDMLDIINEYRKQELNLQDDIKEVKMLTIGNPDIIFRLGIEAIKNNFQRVVISINDFCLAQNELIVATFNDLYRQMKFTTRLELINIEPVEKLVANIKKFDKVICISDSYRYYLLKDKVSNISFYPYNLFELYADSDEFDDLKKKVFDYASYNGYEIGIYDEEMTLEDAINLMNVDGYGFGCILLSKDKKACERFKKEIKAKYVIVNKNPFSKTKFILEI